MLPTDASIKFIVCDAAREETNNKVSLLGIFPDERLQLPGDARFPAAFPVTFVFFLLDGEGSFNGTIEVTGPPDQPPFSAEMPNISKIANQPGTVIAAFTPFISAGFGAYKVILTLNNQKYTREFQVVPLPAKSA